MRIDDVLIYATRYVGVPYLYGGNNPLTGFDCSGLACEVLKAFDVIKVSDLNAQQLHAVLSRDGTEVTPQLGAILFFGQSVHSISHVAIAVSDKLMIEAGGGDRTTVNLEEAKRRNAFVRQRPIRKDLVSAILPKYDVEKQI